MAVACQLRSVYKLPAKQWEFGQDGHIFTALTPALLVEQVRAYREANQLPVGDVEAQVIAALVKTSPAIGKFSSEAAEAPAAVIYDTLDARIQAWVAPYAQTAPKFAHGVDVLHRIRICAACPCNTPVAWEGMVKDLLLLTRGDSLKENGLEGCSCFEHHNKLAVLLDDYQPAPKAEVPADCWVTR